VKGPSAFERSATAQARFFSREPGLSPPPTAVLVLDDVERTVYSGLAEVYDIPKRPGQWPALGLQRLRRHGWPWAKTW